MLKLFRYRGISRILLNNSDKCKKASNCFHSSLSSARVCSSETKKCEFLIIKPFDFDLTRTLRTTIIRFSEDDSSGEDSNQQKQNIDPAKDRTKIIDPETSIRYLKSKAYKTTYGDEPVWVKYRRNFKGHRIPFRSRETCIRGGMITGGNPCPVCRDEYLVLHYTNVDLLKQFIHPQTGQIYDSRIIHVCRKKLLELEVAIEKAKFYGLLKYDVPFRQYNYNEYYPEWKV
ncbi:28S ribosomal protein S18b, mitochondrial [Trichonephila clavipes]|nr:28S ribosomal protein S18b, mitochondrial [Trichonephila clavipes]